MDGWVDEWIDGWMDGSRMDGQTGREMSEWMDECMEGIGTVGQTDRQTEGWMHEGMYIYRWLDRQMNGLIDGMNKWMSRQIDGWIGILPSPNCGALLLLLPKTVTCSLGCPHLVARSFAIL